MIFKQFYLGCLAHASYLIGDEGSRMAAVIDPQRDVDRYLGFAAEHGLQIKHVKAAEGIQARCRSTRKNSRTTAPRNLPPHTPINSAAPNKITASMLARPSRAQ